MKIRQVSTRRMQQRFTAVLGALIVLSLVVIPATASHSWGRYHWARASNPITLKTGDNVDLRWDAYLDIAVGDADSTGAVIGDWNSPGSFGWQSTPVNVEQVTGTANNLVDCGPTAGMIEVCNAEYGANGWLGIAQIWTFKNHISQGNAKLNDTYFDTEPYTAPAWRQMVMCQEIAHVFGLDHQDETFNNPNLGSCMDYTNDPDGGADGASESDPSNEHPNAHDFQQLETIYDHADKTGGGPRNNRAEQAIGNNPGNWGEVIERDGKGRPSLYRKDLGNDRAVFTFVIYADNGSGEQAGPGHSSDGHSHGGTVDDGKKADGKRDGGKKADGKKDKKQQDRNDKRRR